MAQPAGAAIWVTNLSHNARQHELWYLLAACGGGEAVCFVELAVRRKRAYGISLAPLGPGGG